MILNFRQFVAEVGGGRHGKRRRFANFAPQNTASIRESGAELTQTWRQSGKNPPLGDICNNMARMGEFAAILRNRSAAVVVAKKKCRVLSPEFQVKNKALKLPEDVTYYARTDVFLIK